MKKQVSINETNEQRIRRLASGINQRMSTRSIESYFLLKQSNLNKRQYFLSYYYC